MSLANWNIRLYDEGRQIAAGTADGAEEDPPEAIIRDGVVYTWSRAIREDGKAYQLYFRPTLHTIKEE